MLHIYKLKDKGHRLTCCASTEDRQGYCSSKFANGMGGQLHASVAWTLEGTDIHSTGSWVVLWAYLDGVENIASAGIQSPDRPAHTNHSKIPFIRINRDAETVG
jgi:hypothetical protein